MPEEPRLVTQVRFQELTGMRPIDIVLLIEYKRLPTVKRNGADMINLADPRAKCWLPENRGRNLF